MKRLFTFATPRCRELKSSSQRKRNMLVRMMVMAIAMMILAPSAMKGATTTIDFTPAAIAAQFHADSPSSDKYYANIVMSNVSYDAIGNGAKIGNVIQSKNSKTNPDIDISRLAFVVNTNGVGNADNTGAGFYLRRNGSLSSRPAGLYTGASGNTEFAILNLKPGNKVTISFTGGNGVYNVTQGQWFTSGSAMTISNVGDLRIGVTQGTYIASITIESEVAEYDISTSADGKKSTFVFTKDGLLDNNDFTLPNVSASFGSIYDYLVVQNYESHMYKTDGTENLVTDPTHNFQPSAGSFYEFKPTAGGKITIEGSLQGSVMHLFVYDPTAGANGTGDWIGQNGNIYYDTFTSGTYTFTVTKGLIYYICQNNWNESGNAFHLKKFTFESTYYVQDLGVIINDVDNYSSEGHPIQLTKTEGLGGYELKVKRCSANIKPSSLTAIIDQHGWLYMSKPEFEENTDHAGTVIWDLHSDNGDNAIVVTFPYHASFNDVENPDPYRTYGHTWNFIDPRNSDSNIGNCLIRSGIAHFDTGTTTGILSIGQDKDIYSTFHQEVQNREWTYSQRQTGSAGGFHDPYYANVWDMEGDNADMIWETEGLWFDTGTNLSCIYNEKDAYDQSKTNPLDFAVLGTDPDRYVGLLPVTDGKKSSFTIPGLKPGDRVLIFMKSGEATGTNGIFLNITGAKDALGKAINPSDLYKAGGTNWQHERYEGCYHFIKDETKDPGSEYGRMTFSMNSGSMCKLLYIRIYTGQRIVTTNIVSSATGDPGRLLFMNDKGATDGQGSQFSLRFRGKGQHSTNQVLTYSGNLKAASFEGDNFKVTGAYSHLIDFKSKVGEIGMFRLRMNDITYEYEKSSDQKITYVADFCDRNFTVGYRDKVDSYPYTWDFTDIQGFSSSKMDAEADNYPIAAAANDAYGYEWDISLFDAYGNMKVNTGWDPITNNLIFSPHKIGFGNQLWAGGNVIPETRGLWFYSEDDSETGYTSDYSSALYNDCLQITSDGIRFANVPDQAGKRVAWWNYKMVVPDVPADGAVYLRMKRDTSVPDDAKTHSTIDNADVPFVATRFQFASQTAKTQLSTDTEIKGNGNYAFYKVNGSDDEWILAVKNTGSMQHLTFTLNGWIVKKVAVSTDSKTVNNLGYASESRNHEIDPELMGYMTGTGLKAYTVTSVNYGDEPGSVPAITLSAVPQENVIGAATTGDHNAYIIYNSDAAVNDSKKVSAINNGFHLFVPDMHDKTKMADGITDATDAQKSRLDVTNNSLCSWLEGGSIPQIIGDYTVYLMNSKGYNEVTGQVVEGEEAFYRASNKASLGANKAYLQLLTEEVMPSNGKPANSRMAIIFVDDESGSETTALDGVNSTETISSDSGYYTLSGVKVERPTKSGIYIKNGKKIIIK